MRGWVLVAAAVAFSASSCILGADFLAGLPKYQPSGELKGVIRLWGNNYIPALVQAWEDGFRKIYPGIRFETSLPGSEAAVAGLYGGIADVAFVGRELYPEETAAFTERTGYPPLEVRITSGSFNTPHKTFALMVFVHKDNPLARMSISQLDAIFGTELKQGALERIRTWDQLGLSGEWQGKAVHVYGYQVLTGMARFFQKTVLKDSDKWNESMRDFDNGRRPDGDVINAGVYVLQALSEDKYGIAYANVLHATPSVKALALAGADGAFVEPSVESAWHRAYPLTRYTSLVLKRQPGRPIEARVAEFVRYILSREGMAATVADGAYLPLNPALVEQELRKIE